MENEDMVELIQIIQELANTVSDLTKRVIKLENK